LIVEAHPGAYFGIALRRDHAELIVGNSWCSCERRSRRHTCPAEEKWVAFDFGLFGHGLSSDGTTLSISTNPVFGFDERTLGSSGVDHKRKELSSQLRKIQV
jgi:hypothetical protein